jgi:putative ABC transport system permease protein
MTRALARTAVADLRRHRLQSVLLVVILATATMTMTLAVTINRTSTGPFERLFRETHGAHVWFTAEAGVDLTTLAALDGVEESGGPFALGSVEMTGPAAGGRDAEFPLDVMALPADRPAMGRPLIEEGRWLAGPDEVVVVPGMAHFGGLRVGDEISVEGPAGPESLRIVGLAEHVAFWQVTGSGVSIGPYGFVLPETLERLVPDQTAWRSVLGVRLADPDASREFAGAALDRLAPTGGVSAVNWLDLKEAVTEDNEVYVVLLGVFSLFALMAAGLVIANSIGGRVVAQIREIGLLKAVGFTPRGIAGVYLAQNLLLGLVSALLGLAAGVALTPMFEENLSELFATTRVSPYEPVPLLLVLVAVVLAVAFCTLVPALRGARIGTVEAIVSGGGRVRGGGSRLAAFASRFRLPVVVVVGLKDAFARPLRAWVTVAALVLTIVTLTFSIGMESTLRDIVAHPERWGTPYDLLIAPNGTTPAETERILGSEPAVASYVTQRDVEARVEGTGTTISVFALGGDLSLYGSSLAEGRLMTAPGEAVAGQALLDLVGKGIGDTVRLWIDETPVDLTIVGRVVAADEEGLTVLFGLDTYRAVVDGTADAGDYAVRLRPGSDPFVAMAALRAASAGRFDVRPQDFASAGDFALLRGIMFGLDLVLLVIGAVNLLTTTMLGVRERVRDVGILKSIGFTPLQAVQSVLVGIGAVTVVAVAVGIPFGLVATRVLFDELGRRLGVGPGLGVMPGLLPLVLLLPATLTLAIVAGLLPARRAAAIRVSEALRYQ